VSLVAAVIVIGALVGFAVWALAHTAWQDRGTSEPGPVDVTDRSVTPPAPGSRAARRIDAPGSQRDRSSRGKP
jgi:hypothetical protein